MEGLPDVNTCASCDHWRRKDQKARHGFCRAAPPVRTSPTQARGLWPLTDQDEGCGQHLAKASPRTATRGSAFKARPDG